MGKMDCGSDADDDVIIVDVDGGGIIDCNRSLASVIGCFTFRLKSLPNRSETTSFVVMYGFCVTSGAVALSIFELLLLLPLPADFHREPSILNDARTDLLRRRFGDGVESGRRRYEWSFSLFISITQLLDCSG